MLVIVVLYRLVVNNYKILNRNGVFGKMDKLEFIWIKALKQLRNVLNEETYATWLKPIVPLSLNDGIFKLGVSDAFFISWLQDNFNDMITSAISSAAGAPLKIEFEEGYSQEQNTDMPKEELYVTPAQTKEQTPRAANCHHKHTFSNFIVGPENEFAYAATKSISDSSTPPIANPLFIYGGTGLGKTHLMQAVAHLITEENPNIVVEYISCEHFLNLYVKGIKENNPSKFRNRFRKADYLIIDDIHFIAGKIQLQEEFFNTFNKLYNEDRKILLTSDRKPSEIGGLEQRLISRFDSGLTVDIQPPGLETRLAILKKKQEEHLIKLNNDVLLFVAEKISSDVRKLEGAITRLLTYASLKGGEITLEIAEKILRPILEDIVINNITIESIQKKVADHFDLKVADLTSSKRPRNIAVPRMIAMYFARKMTDKSLPEIGRSFARNHATVLHAVKEIEKRNIKDENIRYTMSILERQLQNS